MRGKQAILLGIVGDSAAGKSTPSHGIAQILGPERVTILAADDYHKYDRRERAALGITPLHPDCNYLDIFEIHLQQLRQGLPILKPVYDHSTGTFTRPEYVKPTPFIIVDGLLAFYRKGTRDCFDVKVYLDPPENLRRVRKIQRDTTKRGYTMEQVLAEMERREPDSAAFIRPQRRYADIVVQFYPPEGVSPAEAGSNLNVRLILRPTIPHPDLTTLPFLALDQRTQNGQRTRLRLDRDGGQPVDVLEIDADVPTREARELESYIWAHLPVDAPKPHPETIGWFACGTEVCHSHPLALTQVLVAYHMLYAVTEASRSAVGTPAHARTE